jgi:hypothetical protein
LNIIVRQLPNQGTHRLHIIIHAAKQDALIADHNPILKQLLRRLARDPRELARVVEMRVNSNLFTSLLATLRQSNQLPSPRVLRIQGPGGRNAQSFGGDAETSDVRNGEHAVADGAQLFRVQVIRVTTRDDNVLDGWRGGDVGEGVFPAAFAGLVGGLDDGIRVAADSVGARAVSAVQATDGCCWMLMSMTVGLLKSDVGW